MILRLHDDGTWLLRFAGASGAVEADRLAVQLTAVANSMRCSGAEFGVIAMPEGFAIETLVAKDAVIPTKLPPGRIDEVTDVASE